MTIHPNAVLRLFWSRTRKCVLPRNRQEIVEALKGNPDRILDAIDTLEEQGLVNKDKRRGEGKDGMLRCYDITDDGLAAVQSLTVMTADPARRSVAQSPKTR